MSSLSSSVLLVGITNSPSLALDCETVPRLDQITQYQNAQVMVLPVLLAQSQLFRHSFEKMKTQQHSLQLVLIADDKVNEESLRALIHDFPIFRILESFQDPALESALLEALEHAQWIRQNDQLRSLVRGQNEKLKLLYQQLEDRVVRRTRFLEEARKKSLLAQSRSEAIRQATVAIHQASGIPEMESRLLEVLKEPLFLESVRIFPGIASISPKDPRWDPFTSHRVALFNHQDRPTGVVIFFRAKDNPFSTDEKEFFQRLSETLNPALQRLGTLKTRENFKEEWEATFNAVGDPVAIINRDFEIVQTNSTFLQKSGHNESVVGMKCYHALFHRDTPCGGCRRGANFRLESRRDTFDVSSQTVLLSPDEDEVYVHQYHDVTEQIRMERRILDSARLAELGTIGSSIAHELNNPLGGILSYVQLVKSELPTNDALIPDLTEMENGVLRCRDIVQNLLSFTRSRNEDAGRATVDLREVIARAVSLLELKTRSQGIEVKTLIPDEPVEIEGHFNQLTQALQNVLQSALSSVQEKMYSQRGFHPVLEIKLQRRPEITLLVLDNGRGLETAPSLEIPLAQRIFLEHGAHLEILSTSSSLRLAKISFPRPVLATSGP